MTVFHRLLAAQMHHRCSGQTVVQPTAHTLKTKWSKNSLKRMRLYMYNLLKLVRWSQKICQAWILKPLKVRKWPIIYLWTNFIKDLTTRSHILAFQSKLGLIETVNNIPRLASMANWSITFFTRLIYDNLGKELTSRMSETSSVK